MVQPCLNPTLCHLNVNGFLYGNQGPFNPKFTCLNDENPLSESKKLLLAENFGFTSQALEKHLTLDNIYNSQQQDLKCKTIFDKLSNNEDFGRYFLNKGILCKKYKDPTQSSVIVISENLIPYVLAMHHLKTHGGYMKMLSTIRLRFYWKNMQKDIKEFCRSCILCSIFKNSNEGKTEIGTPKLIQKPLKVWQMDIVTGLNPSNGYKAYINFVDMYSGYTIPVALKTENSAEIAKAIENNIIKVFNCPEEISSDNASNLQGPEVRKLLNFYNIKQRFTTPYSPESHGLVEIQNRYITELTRIFCDQFQVNWPEVLTIAALVLNSVPRNQLKNHSPHFIVFGQEPFGNNDFRKVDEKYMDIDEFVKESIKNKIYIKLIREYLIQQRIRRNAEKNRKYKSIPKDTLIFVKDLRPKIHKKIKPIFYKIPEKVITEYHSIVYSMDIFGRVNKRSKNNIKIASDRSIRLFESLPEDIKLILGDVFNLDVWEKIKDEGIVPLYLLDIENSSVPIELRSGKLPLDTHLLEKTKNDIENLLPKENEMDEILEAELDTLDSLNESTFLKNLNELHEQEQLLDENVTIENVPDLYKNMDKNPSLNDISKNLPIEETQNTIPLGPQNAEIDQRNIIMGKRDRHVRFNI